MIHNWLTIPDAAKAANVTQRTIYRWISKGIRTRTTCGTTFVYLPHVQALVDNHTSNVRRLH